MTTHSNSAELKTRVAKKYLGKIGTHAAGYSLLVKLKPIKGMEKAEGKEWISDAGIVVPEKAGFEFNNEQARISEAEVVSIGPSAFQDFLCKLPWCNPGDTIVIQQRVGKEIYDEATDTIFHLIIDSDVKAVIGLTPPGWDADEYKEFCIENAEEEVK